ncbi:MAG TPA: bifunctional riboflavin kinase/FAD synthetase [Chitinophagaceae bacterium]|nr:bifunctional riboflavin kinase/FAD synthetase [Chitinophagaceae bacterium]
MQVHKDLEHLPVFRKAVITIGTFDGVHLGHRQIISRLLSTAKDIGGESVIITFHPHPRKVIASSHPIRLINTLEEKIQLLDGLGVDHLVVVAFTDAFSNQDASEYIRHFLVERFAPHTIIIGYDHRFGKERKGDYLLLEKFAPIFDYELQEIPKHVLDEISISSTNIRQALNNGEVEAANRLLGYDFFFTGKVIDGDKLGRTLGYPTANLEIGEPEKIIPGDGIYAVLARLGQVNPVPGHSLLKGMMSIGFRPTVGGTKRVIEVNLFDFDSSIYGQQLTVYVKAFLRKEAKFDSLEMLVSQIDKDKISSLERLK